MFIIHTFGPLCVDLCTGVAHRSKDHHRPSRDPDNPPERPRRTPRGPNGIPRRPQEAPGGPCIPDRMVFTRVQACRIHDCTVFTRLQKLVDQEIQKNSMKNTGLEFIRGFRGFPGFPGNGVSSRS